MKQCGMMKRVLCLVADGVEELELVAPVDVLRRAGCEVVLAAVGEGIHVTGRNGITLHADTRLDEVVAADFEALLLPGGPAVKTLMADERVLGLCRKFAEEDKGLAAICAAVFKHHGGWFNWKWVDKARPRRPAIDEKLTILP